MISVYVGNTVIFRQRFNLKGTKMRKAFVIMSGFFFAAVLSACGGDGSSHHAGNDGDNGDGGEGTELVEHHPGEIPGLGEYPGELQGTPFILPQGVMLNGDIHGYDWSMDTTASSPLARTTKDRLDPSLFMAFSQRFAISTEPHDIRAGSGFPVEVVIPLLNTNPEETTVVFPARLIIRANSGQYQNGVLLKDTVVKIPASSEYSVILVMYCGNLQREGSAYAAVYEWGIISDSLLLKDLTDRLRNKKINVEEYDDFTTPAFLWTSEAYWQVYERLSNMLWNLTDRGIALTESDKEWIEALSVSQ